MSLNLLLPWFPIVLGVGVGGRLLGRGRGFALGLLCALFWIVLVQASGGFQVWSDPWCTAGILIGAVAIVLMGGWSGEFEPDKRAFGRDRNAALRSDTTIVEQGALQRLWSVSSGFQEWVDRYSDATELWLPFSAFIRESLFLICGATHVKIYEVQGDGKAPVILGESNRDESVLKSKVIARLIDQVLLSGNSFVAGVTQDHPADIVDRSGCIVAWCFPVSLTSGRYGVITAESIGFTAQEQPALLRLVEHWVSHWWRTIDQTVQRNSALKHDPACGVLNRRAFLDQGQVIVREALTHNEPIAVAMIAVHGLRDINDSGQWEIADELLAEVGKILKDKVRPDDRIGRFDGSRFVWLLRRVDAELAGLIVRQVVSKLLALSADKQRWGADISVRCGLVNGHDKTQDLRDFVSRALVQSRRARVESVLIATDASTIPRERTEEVPA